MPNAISESRYPNLLMNVRRFRIGLSRCVTANGFVVAQSLILASGTFDDDACIEMTKPFWCG
jgi:hypothetical protein